MKPNINVTITDKKCGIKIVDSNMNKRDSDIFNRKREYTFQNSLCNRNNKQKIIEITEKMIDDRLRSSSPYVNGKKNVEYLPQHLNSSIDIGDQEKIKTNYNRFIQHNIHKEEKQKLVNKSLNEIIVKKSPEPFEKKVVLNKSASDIRVNRINKDLLPELKVKHMESFDLNVNIIYFIV
jgi:hypothetical protein